jgi:flagellar P-ring protein FlgI
MRFRALVLCLVFLFSHDAIAKVRIKDVSTIRGVRENQLFGYGLVVGLQGSGDTLRNSVFTEQSLQSMLDRLGIAVRNGVMRTRNVAAVMVTADVPAYFGIGSRIDVTVSSLGDASSLMGGTLIMTPLAGPNGIVYASAQGAVSGTGHMEAGKSEMLVEGVPTSGRIVSGALIEREMTDVLIDTGKLVLELRNPDFSTAIRVVDVINAFSRKRYGARLAVERDNRSIEVARPLSVGPARFASELGNLLVEPDTPARIVIDARSGTVVIGADVKISTVAVTHGALSVRITETPSVSQPEPLSKGETVVTSQTEISARQGGGQMAILKGASLNGLVRGLNQIGLKPSGIIAILQAIKTAGALQADVIAQ